jgi:hypothetical protein
MYVDEFTLFFPTVSVFRKQKSVSDDEIVEDGPKLVKMEAVTEDDVTPEVNEVAPDSELSVEDFVVKLEEVDVPVDEEDPSDRDHNTQSDAASESSSEPYWTSRLSSIPSEQFAAVDEEVVANDAADEFPTIKSEMDPDVDPLAVAGPEDQRAVVLRDQPFEAEPEKKRGSAPLLRSLDEWRGDPDVLFITEEGLPPGWAKIVKRYNDGKRAFFKSPTKSYIK